MRSNNITFLDILLKIFKKIKIIISFYDYMKYFTKFQAGITKLVNGAGLFWKKISNNRTQDLIKILPVEQHTK